jgi:hypothetical protein
LFLDKRFGNRKARGKTLFCVEIAFTCLRLIFKLKHLKFDLQARNTINMTP